MRKSFVAGNWKMNNTIAQATELAEALMKSLPGDKAVDVAVIPPFLSIPAVARVIEGSPIKLGAQDVYFEESGAFTGEISPSMIADAGCTFALVGHSERRHVLGEDDALVRRKLDALLAAGLQVILCVGEKIEEREADQTQAVLTTQVTAGIRGLTGVQMQNVTIAYEPVWAIGTGKTATTEQAQSAHAYIRGLVADIVDADAAAAVRIQYGGSVKPDNAAELMGQPDVDGALVGGASLKVDSFVGIINGG